jgi:recombination protein RecR
VPLPQAITSLSEALGRLPGIGPRSAERLALHLAQSNADDVRQLAQALVQARERVRACNVCGSLAEEELCAICADPRRDGSILCVVERPLDVFALEKAGSFRGKYHVLGGKISPLNGVEPEDLRVAELEARLTGVQEVIMALSTDVEGDATSFYLGKRLAGKAPKISRLAHGLPAGTGLEFADEVTLNLALEGRRELAS